jgi:hypothetical protein
LRLPTGTPAAVDLLAERYDLPLVGVFTAWYAALRLAVTGRPDEARTAYRAAAARLAGTGMPGMEEVIRPIALLAQGYRDRQAQAIADKAQAPHWATAARDALHRLGK